MIHSSLVHLHQAVLLLTMSAAVSSLVSTCFMLTLEIASFFTLRCVTKPRFHAKKLSSSSSTKCRAQICELLLPCPCDQFKWLQSVTNLSHFLECLQSEGKSQRGIPCFVSLLHPLHTQRFGIPVNATMIFNQISQPCDNENPPK